MILISHGRWSRHSAPVLPLPLILVPFFFCHLPLVQFCFFLSPIRPFLCLIFSVSYLSYQSCCILPLFCSASSILDHCFFKLSNLQVMWTQVKAPWWATSCSCWAMSTSAPCTSMSRSRRRLGRPPSPTPGSWMKPARKGTGALQTHICRTFVATEHS